MMMTNLPHRARHDAEHTGRSPLEPAASDLIRVGSRRWFLQTGLAGLASASASICRSRPESWTAWR
jgi:hypothetical protein